MKKRLAVGVASVGLMVSVAFGSAVAAQDDVYPPTAVDSDGETVDSVEITIDNLSISVSFPDGVPPEFAERFSAQAADEDGTLTITISAPCKVPNQIRISFNEQSVEAVCESTSSDQSVGASAFLLTPSLDAVGSVRFQTSNLEFDGIATATFDAPTVAGDYVVTAVDLVTGFETDVTLAFEAAPGGGPGSGDGLDLGTVIPAVVGLLIVAALIFVVVSRRSSESDVLT